MTTPPDFEALAAQRLPEQVRAYVASGAGSGLALAEAEAAWAALRFRPRILTDVSTIDTTTTVLGAPVASPIMIAPMAQQTAADPEGEVATARAAAATGALLGVSSHTATRFADIAAQGAPWWFQVYVFRDHEATAALVRRAAEHGASAILLTTDMTALLPSTINPRNWPAGPGARRHVNLTDAELERAGVRGLQTDPSVGPATVGWLRSLTDLPLVVKGVLRGDDAVRCVDAGAAGILVSSHGGRRMGASISAAQALPEVRAAVPAEIEVYADSGLRSAEHVAAALALGARGVFVGRPVWWALAAAGSAGVQQLLEYWTAELTVVMTQLGVAGIGDFRRDLLG